MLDGIRVVEFEGLGPGPFAAMLLADLGAEVSQYTARSLQIRQGALNRIFWIGVNDPSFWT